MVKLGWRKSEFELLNLDFKTLEGAKKVGVMRRKASGKVYESPRIILNRHYKKFIDRNYTVYFGRAKHTSISQDEQTIYSIEEGDCLILFFPDQWNKKTQEE